MLKAVHNLAMVASISIFAIGVTGCDLINPPKKPAKKAAKSEAVAEPQEAKLSSDTVAVVGSWKLSQDEFKQRLKLLKEGLPDFDENKSGNKEAVLNELIRQQLLVQDAEAQGIDRQEDITAAVEDFRRTLLVQELASRLTKDKAATEKDAKEYYEANKEIFVDPIEWKVREIVVADEAAAKNILVQVLQGADFGEIAKAQSKGKTAANGGVLPVFTTDKAPFAAMQAAIVNLDAGGTSGVFKGPDGYYIVKVDEKKGGAAKAFADVKEDVISGLTLRKQQEAILEHIDELAKKIKVEVNKDLLGTGTQK
jgi:peptidyl-prolyl cis-trans isomerase C